MRLRIPVLSVAVLLMPLLTLAQGAKPTTTNPAAKHVIATPEQLVWKFDLDVRSTSRDVIGGGMSFKFDLANIGSRLGEPELTSLLENRKQLIQLRPRDITRQSNSNGVKQLFAFATGLDLRGVYNCLPVPDDVAISYRDLLQKFCDYLNCSFFAHSWQIAVCTSFAPGTQWSQKPMASLPAACEVRM